MTREEAKPFYIRVQGNRNYFSAAGRISWFRQAHPDYTILTTPHTLDFDKGIAIFVATIMDPAGRVLSMGHKSCTAKQFPEWITKSETGAVNRALILLGFGEPDEDELDESDTQPNVGARVVDAPQETRQARPQPQQAPQSPAGQRQPAATSALPEPICVACGKPVTEARLKTCYHGHKPVTCPTSHCQQRAAAMAQQPGPEDQPALVQ